MHLHGESMCVGAHAFAWLNPFDSLTLVKAHVKALHEKALEGF